MYYFYRGYTWVPDEGDSLKLIITNAIQETW